MSEVEIIGGNESLNGLSVDRMAEIMQKRRQTGNSDASMSPDIKTARARQQLHLGQAATNRLD